MSNKRFFLNKKKSSLNNTPKPKKISNEFYTDEYKESIRVQSYLGKKGYTISKEILNKDDLEFLYKDLFLKPAVSGPVFCAATPDESFPVYRESSNKIYIPRFYGIKRYGLPPRCDWKLLEGTKIDVSFDKPLRDYQEKVVDTYINHVSNPLYDGATVNGGGGLLSLPCGFGKTICAIKLVSIIKQKTLIVVHKEFLMNQWIERIQEFLPNATVGRIQGPIFDVKDKDIVLGMLQTLYDRDFPEGAFDEFGMCIVDEVHRISSSQFHKALLRISCPYMLGITATLERKDKMDIILNLFIGDCIYSMKRDANEEVNVRGIEFISNDYDFNENTTDFRGNTAYSIMLSKVCTFGPRLDFIIKILKDLVDENPESQILVLGHTRDALDYLQTSIDHKGFSTAGKYIGGMKQSQLEESTDKQIILATYAMASEGFDHKNLSILVMISPKTDIVQSVGRILRQKHDNTIIVDIIDKHDTFQNQWNKRRVYYKKCNYKIQMNNSVKYTNMIEWNNNPYLKTLFEPKKQGDINHCEKTEPKKCMIQISEDELNHDLLF